jgi:long-subunit fatty acid transport protein
MRQHLCRAGLLVAWVTLLAPTAARAQSGQTAQIPLQFDFLNPGARSLGLGSAFIAVADDATAALTNPAGLTLLVRPEVSAELRYRGLDTRYLSGGRLNGVATNLGIDTPDAPAYDVSGDSAARPYFVSGVYPRGQLSVAVYRHELVLQKNSFLSQGPFVADAFSNNVRFLGLTATREISVDNLGASVAYRISDQLSVGVGVAAHRFHVKSSFASLGSTEGGFGPANPDTRGLGSTTDQSGDGTKASVNAGVLIRPHRTVRLGLVYRQGTSFDYTQVSSVPGLPEATQIGRFRTPAVFGVGIRVQPDDRWSFAADYDRVTYSRLAEDFIHLQVAESAVPRVSVPDGSEVHIGAEYTLLGVLAKPTLRAGTWFDPRHAVQYSPDGTNSTTDLLLRAVFPGGDDAWHYTFGAGVPFSPRAELNVGADFTKDRRYVSVSIVARFGK